MAGSMKERPILFSAPMVRAILAGTKTQTRRVAKGLALEWLSEGFEPAFVADDANRLCPYGQPGDRIYVREAFRLLGVFDADSPIAVGELCLNAGYPKPWAPIQYEADGSRDNWMHVGTPPHDDGPPEAGKLRPGIHMPRWASRILLEIVGVRVERLQDISDADAIAEGIERNSEYPTLWKRGNLHGDQNIVKSTGFPKLGYRSIWEQINGAGSWAANPWVWVVEFRSVT
jgi:hypothetical protein